MLTKLTIKILNSIFLDLYSHSLQILKLIVDILNYFLSEFPI